MFSSTGQRRLPTLLLLLVFTGFASPALAVNFNALWDYQQLGVEGREPQSQFQQRYSLGAGAALGLQPTHAISASGAVSYTKTQRGDAQGRAGADQLTPSAGLSLMNDIFQTQLSGSTTFSRADSGESSSQSSWDASLGSSWDIPLWPKLRFSYGERFQFSDRLSLSGEADQKVKDSSVSFDWDLLRARLFYRYNNSQTEDLFSNSVVNSDSHFARFETGGNFWDNRLGFTLAQQLQTNTQRIHVDLGGEFREPLPGQTLVKVDATTDPNPTDPDYVDPADVDPVGVLPRDVALNERVHFQFVTTSFLERIDLLRLTLADPLTVQLASGLQWDVFIKRTSLDPVWESVPGPFQADPSLVANSIEIRFAVPIEAAEILVVATNDSGLPLRFTEFGAFSRVTADARSASSNYLTNLGTRYQISRTLTAAASLTMEQLETDSGGGTRESDRWSVSGNLRWTPVRFVSPSLGFSENHQEQTGQPEVISRTYSLTVPTYPLPAVSVTFGATRSENFTGGLKTGVANRYSLVSRAPIYPDLTAAWSLSFFESETFDNAGPVSDSATLSSRLDLNARFYRNLTGDLVTSWRKTESDTGSTQSADATLGLRYRPSDLLGLRGAYTTTLFGDARATDRLTLGLDLRLLVTQKTRLTFNAIHTQADEQSTDNLSLFGTWDISRNLSLLSRANYTFAETNVYSFQASLSLRL